MPPSKRTAAGTSAASVVAALEAAVDAQVRTDMSQRYGIHTPRALGVTMANMRAIAKPIGTDHALAGELWSSGWYEARIVAALVDDPALVTSEQMDQWCADFDNWAIVDTVCFSLFDRTDLALEKVDQWAPDDREFVRRAAFALLWSVTLHRPDVADDELAARLRHAEDHADDPRHLVHKAIIMAVRAMIKKRPGLHQDVKALGLRLAESTARPARAIARTIERELAKFSH